MVLNQDVREVGREVALELPAPDRRVARAGDPADGEQLDPVAQDGGDHPGRLLALDRLIEVRDQGAETSAWASLQRVTRPVRLQRRVSVVVEPVRSLGLLDC